MRASKAKAFRRQAQSLTIGQPEKFLVGTRKEPDHPYHLGTHKPNTLHLEHAHSSTRAVYQRLKHIN